MVKKSFLSSLIVLSTGVVMAQTAGDPMLDAMKAELQRNQEKLVLPGMQRPFFMEYRMEDIHQYQADAAYGALTQEQETNQRAVRVEVRVGDYKSDSSTGRGEGTVQLAPTDNDPVALRYALWFATDEAYKAALNAYSRKQAELKRFQTPPTADDFSPAKPVTAIEPLVKLELDRTAWKKRITEASGLYATDAHVKDFAADIQTSNARIQGVAANRYVVNTDGTELRHGYSTYMAVISVGTQAPDGMRLSRDNGPIAVTANKLETEEQFRKRVIDNLISLRDLRNAPVVTEEYHGPILFSGDAATDAMNKLFVPNVEADKPEMGTTARTQGAYSSSYKSRVLPDFMDVKDDPTMKSFAGQELVGAYAIDDEGVPAQPVQVVSKGMLQNYLMSREPIKDFPASNGHGRAALARTAQSRSGVMLFEPTVKISRAELEKKVLALAKEQDRPFVYMAETLGTELSPRLLYRVTPDGKRELVRGAVFDELDQRSLRSDILAAGDDPYVLNEAGPIPQTTIAPSLLFGDVAIKRAQQEQEKLPYYPPPGKDAALSGKETK